MSTWRRRVLTAILPLLLAPGVAGAVDLNGKWRFGPRFGPPPFVEIVQVTQSGSALSFTLFGFAFSGSVGTSGTFTSYEVEATTPPRPAIFGRIMPSGNLLDGGLRVYDPPDILFVGGVVATRCTCDDGNTANGDGCDATCQVEPCWTCAGDPSICSPASDGSACEDGSACTSGETCSAGACGGGAPVSPCTDMTGRWNRHVEVSGGAPGPSSRDFASDVTQRGTDLFFFFGDPASAGVVGTIDPATGSFDVRGVNGNFFCPTFEPLIGSVASNGETYTATGTVYEPLPDTPDHCGSYPVTETGTRCGNGTIDPVEECDDGNLMPGDGCDASCRVEPCYGCTGSPSSCAPRPQTGGCLNPVASGAASLLLKDSTDDARDLLAWTWTKGAATLPSDFGDPVTTTDYTLCVFEKTGPGQTPRLALRARAPADDTCAGKPCWTATRSGGFKYRDPLLTPDGLATLTLIPGPAGSAKVLVAGQGPNLDLAGAALPLETPVTVQLRGGSGCWEAKYSRAAPNNAKRFRAESE